LAALLSLGPAEVTAMAVKLYMFVHKSKPPAVAIASPSLSVTSAVMSGKTCPSLLEGVIL
jgi:hypothetical protein